MARTWSNAKRIDTESAAQRAANRPSSLTAFVILLGFVLVLFSCIMIYTTVRMVMHPPLELPQTTSQPKEE